MKLHPGLEIQGPCCRGWHVLFQPEGWEHDTTASRNFYWRCAKNGSKGAYYAGALGRNRTVTRSASRETGEMLYD